MSCRGRPLLIAEGDAAKLPAGQTLTAELAGIGACKIRVAEHTEFGAETEFVGLDAETLDRIEDKLFALHDENAEGVARAMEAGVTHQQDFRRRGCARQHHASTTCSTTNYEQIENSDPPQYRARIHRRGSSATSPTFRNRYTGWTRG